MANPADDKCTNPMDDKSTNPNVSRQTINPELVRTRYVGSSIGHRPFLLHCITISLAPRLSQSSVFPFLHLLNLKRGGFRNKSYFSDLELFISQFSSRFRAFPDKNKGNQFLHVPLTFGALPPISWFLLFHSRSKLMFKPLLGHSPLIMPRFHVGFHKTRFHKIAANLPL